MLTRLLEMAASSSKIQREVEEPHSGIWFEVSKLTTQLSLGHSRNLAVFRP